MDYKQAADYINANPSQFLQRDRHNGFICPICDSGRGKNGTGITSKDGKHFTCWAGNCFANATVTNILALKAGITDTSRENFRQVVEAAARVAGIILDSDEYCNGKVEKKFFSKSLRQGKNCTDQNLPIDKGYIARCCQNLSQTDYLSKRGISLATAAKFAIGYDDNFSTGGKRWQAVIFFTGESSYEARNCDATATGGERHRKCGTGQIFNREALQSTEPTFVCESIIDALSIIEVGGNALSAGGTSGVNMLINAIQGEEVVTPRLILSFDNDEAGRKATATALTKLQEIDFPCESATEAICGDVKDANEALCKDPVKFRSEVSKAIYNAKEHAEAENEAIYEAYMQECAAVLVPELAQEISAHKNFFPTGFPTLDMVLDGGFYAGLYTLGAVSSVGKTTFCLQIADNVAAQGLDVLFFSLEMSKFELMSKSLSRLSYLAARNNSNLEAVTTREILSDKYRERRATLSAVLDALEIYGEYAEHIFLKEGMGNVGVADIRQAVRRHIRITGRRPLVLVDYLQILAPPEMRLSDKQATDKNVLELKRLSRDMNIPILGISSLNRENYNSPINMAAFKESGAIEYGSDVLIGLQHNGMDYVDDESDADRKSRIRDLKRENIEREFGDLPIAVQLKVMKNRNGRKSGAVFNFYPRYNFFEESAANCPRVPTVEREMR